MEYHYDEVKDTDTENERAYCVVQDIHKLAEVQISSSVMLEVRFLVVLWIFLKIFKIIRNNLPINYNLNIGV